MSTPHKWAKEIHAFADGKVVQMRCGSNPTWADMDSLAPPFSHPAYEFRIKPEPKPLWEVAMEAYDAAWADPHISAGSAWRCVSAAVIAAYKEQQG